VSLALDLLNAVCQLTLVVHTHFHRVTLLLHEHLPLQLKLSLFLASELLLTLFNDSLSPSDLLFALFLLETVLLENFLHLQRLSLRTFSHEPALSLAGALEDVALLLDLPLALLELPPLLRECLLRRHLGLLDLSLSLQTLLGGRPLALVLYAGLELAALMVTPLHFHLAALNLQRLLMQNLLGLGLELLLLLPSLLIAHSSLSPSLNLDLLLLVSKLDFLAVGLIRPLLVLESLLFRLLALSLLLSQFPLLLHFLCS